MGISRFFTGGTFPIPPRTLFEPAGMAANMLRMKKWLLLILFLASLASCTHRQVQPPAQDQRTPGEAEEGRKNSLNAEFGMGNEKA